MRLSVIFLVSALTVAGIFLFTSFQEVNSSPRGRGGGGGRGGGSRGGGSRGGGSKGGGSRYGGGSKSSGGYKSKSGSSTKSFAAKNWKKAAAFGAGAYVGYKISSVIRPSFYPGLWYYGGYHSSSWNFNQWDKFARLDGWVCRSDKDCTWIDQNLGCDDREFDLNSITAGWPFKDSLKGRCACEDGFSFDRNTGRCIGGLAGWLIALIVIAVLIGTCLCCGCLCYFARS